MQQQPPTSTPLSLVVISTPNNNLVGNNFVYVNEKQFPSFPIYVKIKKQILTAQKHEKVPLGQVALNKVQRMSCHVSEKQPCEVEIFTPPATNFTLGSLTLGILKYCIYISRIIRCQ
jgi:hypothetical protein